MLFGLESHLRKIYPTLFGRLSITTVSLGRHPLLLHFLTQKTYFDSTKLVNVDVNALPPALIHENTTQTKPIRMIPMHTLQIQM